MGVVAEILVWGRRGGGREEEKLEGEEEGEWREGKRR